MKYSHFSPEHFQGNHYSVSLSVGRKGIAYICSIISKPFKIQIKNSIPFIFH